MLGYDQGDDADGTSAYTAAFIAVVAIAFEIY